ncbi:serine aminopeptidase domain-containing protein [Aquabacterium sp.]|uniref:alpha/beta hydrolase family protein n=1 Tax=Aquabacterium sp. TaxID=1872578 RepID=UPI003783B2BA
MDALPPNASPDLAALEAAFEAPVHPPAADALPPLLTLHCADGTPIAARWYEPAAPARAVAMISAATGVPQRYYRHFAAWLAQRGYAVLSYDYRGIAESRRGPVHRDGSRMRDWALQDMRAALAEAELRRGSGAQRLPLLLIGHSFGGNAAGLAPGLVQADALLTLGAQSGDWRHWPGLQRWITFAYFHGLLPLVSHLLGKAPGWALGGRGDGLPKQVALEWARWGRRRGYLFTDPTLAADIESYRAFRGVAHVWNISDDLTYGPARAVDALAAQFSAARVERHELVPQALGLKRLGHFGAFRAQVGARVWPRLLAPIEAATPALAQALR